MSPNNWKVKLTLLLVSSLTIMSMITISAALPEMSLHFSSIPNAEFLVKLVLTVPALFIAIFAPITGYLIDRYGRLKLLWISIILYALAGSAGFYLNDLHYILISRVLLGVAVGMSMTIVITLVADYFQGIERQKFAGIQIAFMSLGGILFIGFGGVLADISWRHPFLIYLISLFVLPMSIFFLREPKKIEKQEGSNVDIKAPRIIWLLFINCMIIWIIFFLIPVQVPFLLKEIGVEKNALIGAAIAASTAFSAISSFSYSKIKGRLSFKSIFALGYLLMALGFFIIVLADSYFLVLLAMIFCGFGMGLMIPNTNVWVMKIAPEEIRGKEIGKLTTFWFLGQFLSPIIVFPILGVLSISSTFLVGAVALTLLCFGFVAFKYLGPTNA